MTITPVESVVTVSPTAATAEGSPTQLITYDPSAATTSRLYGPVMTISTPASDAKDSSSGPNIGLIVGLIVGFAIVISLLLYLIFRLKKRHSTRGEQIQSPLPSEYDTYRDSTKIEPVEPKHRTRSLIKAFPLPPGSDTGSLNGPNASPFSDFAAVQGRSVGTGPRQKAVTKQDRRSVVSWFSIRSRRKSGFAHRKPSGFEWYRSGVDESVSPDQSGRESALSIAPPVEMFERRVFVILCQLWSDLLYRASPLSQLSAKANEKLWARGVRDLQAHSMAVTSVYSQPDLPPSEEDLTEAHPYKSAGR